MDVKIAFMGFGNVGKALAQLLINKRTELDVRYNIRIITTGISTASHGTAIDLPGIDLHRALSIDHLTSLGSNPGGPLDFIRSCKADVLFESIPVDYANGMPAVEYLRTALQSKMHAITANKGPVVHAFRELTALAKSVDRQFFFEAAVMDGAPIFSLFRETLPAAQLLSFRAVLNSTTNMILTRMEELGESFDQAVSYTQQIGIAETDPSGDIDGWDAAVKVAALVTVLMRVRLLPHQVKREGIRGLTVEQIQQALSAGQRWKLICQAENTGEGVVASVQLERVNRESPFYQVQGTTSLIQFESDVLGRLTLIEENPGKQTTAYGMLADLINAVA